MNWNLIKNFALAAILLLAVGWHVQDKHKAVQEATERTTSVLNAKYDKSLKEAAVKAQKASIELQASADKTRQEKDEKINDINARLAAALSELRKRPNRPANPPEYTGSEQACTARELYREDAEFLTREAARADSILAERDYYYQQYEEVRKKLNGTPK